MEKFKATNVKTTYYPIVISSEKYSKLLAVQSEPEEKYFFKDKEITIEDLVNKLEDIK